VQLFSFISRLLSILAIVGLLTAPMVAPSSAVAMDDASMAGMSGMASVPDDMPCCPNEKPSLPGCAKSCPFAILCLAKCFPAVPAVSVVMPARVFVADVKTSWDDNLRDILPDPPPPKPPRT